MSFVLNILAINELKYHVSHCDKTPFLLCMVGSTSSCGAELNLLKPFVAHEDTSTMECMSPTWSHGRGDYITFCLDYVIVTSWI